MEKPDMNALVSYNSGSDSVQWTSGTTTSGSFGDDSTTNAYYHLFDWDYYRTYPETVVKYYPSYVGLERNEDTYKKAFAITKLLLKKNLLKSRKLKDFIGLVEEIAKEL